MNEMSEAERQDMAERTHAVIDAAIQWWRGRRPVGWTQSQHLAQPTVNTTTPAEAQLASAVAEFLAELTGDAERCAGDLTQ